MRGWNVHSRSSCVWHDSLIHVWHDSFVCMTWLGWCAARMCTLVDLVRDMAPWYVWNDVCDMTHSYVWHDSLVCMTWLNLILLHDVAGTGWLRLVGSLKLSVSFAKEPCKRDYILQKRPIISFVCMTSHGWCTARMCTLVASVCDMPRSYVWNDMCDMTHLYVWHHSTSRDMTRLMHG